MKDRIKKIIDYEGISYTKFADDVGIQRSGVSHLISGRNNPSLEVIQKIIETYDYINIEWLLLGKGNMIKEDKQEKQGNLFSDLTEVEKVNSEQEKNENNNFVSDQNSTDNPITKILSDSPEVNSSNKKILKIVIFYSDKTFTDFIPE